MAKLDARMLQGCLWIDSLMFNLLMGKKKKKAKKREINFEP